MFFTKFFSRSFSRRMNVHIVNVTVRACKVDELHRTNASSFFLFKTLRLHPLITNNEKFPRLDLTFKRRTNNAKSTRLRGDDVCVTQLPNRKWTNTVWVERNEHFIFC